MLPLVSCADFFTESWGKGFARDPGKITVSSSNVKDLLKEAKGDTEASRGILNKIAEKLKDNPNDPVLLAAAITAANQASGLGMLVLENVGTLTDALSGNSDTNVIENLLDAIEEGAKGNKVGEIAGTIAGALPLEDSNPPAFKGDYIDSVGTPDLLLLATTMIVAESEKAGTDIEGYFETWGPGKKDLNDASTLGPSEKLIAALVNEVSTRSDLGGDLGSLLGGN
jgi:hypothetical protein